jgi:hypothetical protein
MAQRSVIASAAFLAVMAGLIYGVYGTGSGPLGAAAVALFVALGPFHFAVGFVGASWSLLLLPLAAVLLAALAGYPEDTTGEPLPLWFGMAIIEVFGLVLLGVGVAAEKLVERRRLRA